MKKKILLLLMILTYFFGITAAHAAIPGITVRQIVRKAIDEYEKQMKNVIDLTTVTNNYTLYQKRAVKGEKNFYKSRIEIDFEEGKYISIFDGDLVWTRDTDGTINKTKLDYDPLQTWKNIAEVPELSCSGRGKVNGNSCFVLTIPDLSNCYAFGGGVKQKKEKIEGKLYVDEKEWIVRQIEMSKSKNHKSGKIINARQIQKFEDFRQIAGVLISYKETVSVIEDNEKVNENIVTVKDIKINTGLADDLFNGRKI